MVTWRRVRWVLLSVGLLAMVLVVTAWLMLQHIPAWYRPARIPAAQLQQVRNDLLATYDSLAGEMNAATGPFDFRLTQEQVNAWLASRAEIVPGAGRWLPPFLSDPAVVIDGDGVRLGITYSDHGLRTVVSARLRLGADAQGIHLRLEEVASGSLGLPRSWIRDALSALGPQVVPLAEQMGVDVPERALPELERLVEGITLPNEGVWQNPRVRFRVVGLRVEPGVIVITFEPIGRQASPTR